MRMAQAEAILFWFTVFTYAIGFCAGVIGFVTAKRRGIEYTIVLLWTGLILHTATVVMRWIDGGHPPVTNTYELNLMGTWFTMLTFLVFEKLRKADPLIAMVITPVVFLILGHSLTAKSGVVPMGPAFQSPWLWIHVIFAWLGFGSYAISTGAAILLLCRQKLCVWRPGIKVPEIERLDEASYRFIVLGFINHAVMLVSGAIWAKKLWGHYWNWDALETWSLLAFLFYAFYLHTRSFLGWKMRRAAWVAALGLIVMSMSFWGVELFSPSAMHPGP